jgi:anti-sigma regulatory factor (Ser/Thr protein kinase)
MSLLSVTHEAAGRTAVVRPEGRLDVRAYPELRDTLLKHAAEIPDALVVDLSGLTADRVTTLSVFPTVWLRISSWPDIPMALAAAGAELSALLHRSAVPRFVPVLRTVHEALAVVGSRALRRRAETTLPAEPASAAAARVWTRERLAHWHFPVCDEALVVVSELVTNTIVHAASVDFTVRLELRPTGLSIAVYDDDPTPPVLVEHAKEVGGIGLVDGLSRAWGHGPRLHGGKVVWAVVPLPGGPEGPLDLPAILPGTPGPP